jgi:hypothetical protein
MSKQVIPDVVVIEEGVVTAVVERDSSSTRS